MRFNTKKITELLANVIIGEVDILLNGIMRKFDDEIVVHEDADDPARPSLCREEFREFLRDTLVGNIKVSSSGEGIEIGIGDNDKLGFGAELDEDTTDCLKIIGTILQGVSGRYVLVTSEMTGGPEGRFGRGFIMPERQYRIEAQRKESWPVDKPIWKFSDFPGLPDFFTNIDLSELIEKSIIELKKAIERR